MKNNKQRQKILGALIILVSVFFAYQYRAKADSSGHSQLISIKQDAAANTFSSNTLEILLKLRSLSLDDSLFEDAVFQNLIDFSLEIEEQSAGRNNPFAPIGVDAAPVIGGLETDIDNAGE
ncbi:MAG: hypothetical protein KAV41_02775 [Candidatus Pacebacteria bacterium]|nr:hypothetical protein [Candidatus Paceibacterota bacterium]